MPTYTFADDDAGTTFLVELRIAELDEFKKEHPHLRQVLVPIGTVDPITAGRQQPPSDFQKFVIDKVKHKTPKNQMDYSRWKIPKEI